MTANVTISETIIDQYHLHPMAGWLYVVIKRHLNRKTGEAFPTAERLAELANMSRASVLRFTKELEAKQLIDVVRSPRGSHQPNRYKLPTDTRNEQQVSESDVLEAEQVSQSDLSPPESISETPVQVSDSNTNLKDKEIVLLPKDGKSTGVPQKPRPPNPMYDAIHAVWGYTASYNGEMAKMLLGVSTRKGFREYNLERPVTPDDLKAWARWYLATELKGDPNLNMLEDRMKIQSSITAWQEKRDGNEEKRKRREEAERIWQEKHPEFAETSAAVAR